MESMSSGQKNPKVPLWCKIKIKELKETKKCQFPESIHGSFLKKFSSDCFIIIIIMDGLMACMCSINNCLNKKYYGWDVAGRSG